MLLTYFRLSSFVKGSFMDEFIVVKDNLGICLLIASQSKSNNMSYGVSQGGKKLCILHELGNKMQLGVWGIVALSVGSLEIRRQHPWEVYNI